MHTPSINIGALYENPVTGERGVVRVAPEEANGHLLVVDLYLRPGGAVAGEHVHPAATEALTVVRGRPAVRHAGRELQADPGTRIEGRPRPLHAAVPAKEFGDTIRFTSPPRLVQRALFGLLAPVARAAGRRALDPDYLNRELPIVGPEPLPDELAGRIPGLAGHHRERMMTYEEVRQLLLRQWTYTGRARRGQGVRVLPRRRPAGVPAVRGAVPGAGQHRGLSPERSAQARCTRTRAPELRTRTR